MHTHTLLGGVCSSGAFSQSGVLNLRQVKLIKVVDDRAVSDKDQCNAVHHYMCVLGCGRGVHASKKKKKKETAVFCEFVDNWVFFPY